MAEPEPAGSDHQIRRLASPAFIAILGEMFTGLIEEVGTVVTIDHAGRLDVATKKLGGKVQLGDSISVNGCCLTVARRVDNHLGFDVLKESFERTNFKSLRPGSPVNLERAVAAGAPLAAILSRGTSTARQPSSPPKNLGLISEWRSNYRLNSPATSLTKGRSR
jgi:Riboflavin synthase alpha chain